MAELVIEPGESLYYDYVAPTRDGCPSFVFVNPLMATPLTPNSAVWSATLPALTAEGYGTLCYDFRGLGQSRKAAETALDPSLLVSDLQRLSAEAIGAPPIFVGLGFGGLIAAGAIIDGAPAAGLVMINGLIEVGQRLDWVNAAAPLLAAEGGGALQMDALLPLLVNAEYLQSVRDSGGLQADDAAHSPDSALIDLYKNVSEADWTLPLEELAAPTLVISGLQDRVFLDREVVNRGFERLRDARAEAWEDAGHLLPVERPQQLARSLIRFAREIGDGGSGG